MGCGCGKANEPKQFIFTGPDGKTVTYDKEIQARVAKIKAGGGTIAAVPKG